MVGKSLGVAGASAAEQQKVQTLNDIALSLRGILDAMRQISATLVRIENRRR